MDSFQFTVNGILERIQKFKTVIKVTRMVCLIGLIVGIAFSIHTPSPNEKLGSNFIIRFIISILPLAIMYSACEIAFYNSFGSTKDNVTKFIQNYIALLDNIRSNGDQDVPSIYVGSSEYDPIYVYFNHFLKMKAKRDDKDQGYDFEFNEVDLENTDKVKKLHFEYFEINNTYVIKISPPMSKQMLFQIFPSNKEHLKEVADQLIVQHLGIEYSDYKYENKKNNT